jgi:hypothetical protein
MLQKAAKDHRKVAVRAQKGHQMRLALYCAHADWQLTCMPILHARVDAVLSLRLCGCPFWGYAFIIALLYHC